MIRPDVLVTNGEYRAGLIFTRSLGKKNLKVQVAGNHPKSHTFYSKYTSSFFTYPDISNGIDKIYADLISNIRKYRPKVFMPLADDCSLAVYKNKREFEKYTNLIPMPTYRQFDMLNSKIKLLHFAMKNNIDMPRTYICNDITDAKKAAKDNGFPVIIKPYMGKGSKGVSLAHNKKSLLENFKTLRKMSSNPVFDSKKILVQEYIPNTLSYYNVFVYKGRIIARHQSKILKTYPPVCGPACSNLSIYDKDLDNAGIKVINKIRLKNGVLNLQFIFDKKKNMYRLLEINPRMASSIQASIDSGVDFPFLLYKAAKGEKVLPVNGYKLDLKVRYLRNEFRRCLQTKKLSDFIDLLNLKNSSTEFDFTDMKPHLVNFADDAYNILESIRHKISV